MELGQIDDFFTNICSSRTLQATESGFFNIYCDAVVESFKGEENYKNWLNNQFGKATSDYTKLQLLYNDPITSWWVISLKINFSRVYVLIFILASYFCESMKESKISQNHLNELNAWK